MSEKCTRASSSIDPGADGLEKAFLRDAASTPRGLAAVQYDAKARGPRRDAVLNRLLRQYQLDTARRLMSESMAVQTKKVRIHMHAARPVEPRTLTGKRHSPRRGPRRSVRYRPSPRRAQHEADLEEERQRCQGQMDRLEGLYANVNASWKRAERYSEDLEKENKALIQTIAHLSEVL